ncbi:hypothetical protein CR513_57508, partial [Mucuna pruriens]
MSVLAAAADSLSWFIRWSSFFPSSPSIRILTRLATSSLSTNPFSPTIALSATFITSVSKTALAFCSA